MPNGTFDSIRSSIEHSIIIDFVIFAANVVLNFIAANFNGLAGFLNDMQTRILGGITANTNIITKVVKQVVGIAEQNILAGILDLDSSVSNAEINILAEVSNNTNLLDIVVGALSDGINVEINNEILVEDSLFGTLLGSVRQAIDSNNSGITGALTIFGDTFQNVFNNLLGVFEEDALNDKPELRNIAEAISENKPETLPVIEKLVDPSEDGFGSITFESMAAKIKDMFSSGNTLLVIEPKVVQLPSVSSGLDFECHVLNDDFSVDTREGAKEVADFLGRVVSLILTPLAQASAISEACLAEWSEDNPWKIVEPGDIIRSFYLGETNQTDTIKYLMRNGYPVDDSVKLINTAQTIPSIDFVIAMWLRGIIPNTQIDAVLFQLGYSELNAARIKEVAFFIPPVQDLITMSVREVFTPAIRARNRQDENFPPEFAEFARQQGVSEEWARNYWAAHWVLPSIQMGFEMMHRGFIDDARLRELLQALDVMPGWVDEIIKISFQPVTRIDIRRLNSVGLLEDQELRKAYRNIGYSPEDAELLSNFTEILNADEEILTFDVASDLTRSNIIGFYVDGILGRAVTFGLLVQAGINVAAAELFLSDADFRIERRDRKQRVDLILDGFKFGGTTFVEANDQLAGLGLESIELQLAQLDLARLQQQETKLPSRADLDKFVKQGIIQDSEYLDMMNRLGYSNFWSVRYLESAGAA